MTRPATRFSLALVVAATLAACQSYPASLAPAPGAAIAPAAAQAGPQDRRVILKGRVQWSAMRRLLATSDDVAMNATVTLLDADGTPVAAGLADASGDFTIYESTDPFEAETDETYTLEVTRRGATDGSETLLSLRTIVQATADDWTSITGETIVVSALTTAVAQLEAEDDTAGPADVIATVDGDTPTAFGATTVDDIEERADDVVAALDDNLDPNQIQPVTITGDVTVTSANDLEDLAHAETITGNLTISYVGTATFSLPRLRTVEGTVSIGQIVEDDVHATDLSGLAALRSVGGLSIDNAHLTSLAGLGKLTEVLGDLALTDMGAGFTSLGALAALTTVEGTLDIENAPGLTGLDLTALTDLGGLSLLDAPALTSLDGLDGVAFPESTGDVDTTISLVNVPLLTDLTGLDGVAGALHRLALDGCDALTSLAGLGDVTGIDELYFNQVGLSSLESLPATLTAVGQFSFLNLQGDADGDGLTSLMGLDAVTISESFNLGGQPSVTSLEGPTFETVLTDFQVDDCDGLTTLGFANTAMIAELTHGLQVTDNDDLTTLGLSGLDGSDPDEDTIGTGGDPTFVFTGNPALADPCEVYVLGVRHLAGAMPETDFVVDDITGCDVGG